MRQAPTALMFRRNKNLSGTKCRVPAEASKENTGIAFAAWAGARPSPSAWFPALGKRVKIFMPDWMSRERRELIRSFGVEIVGVSANRAGPLGVSRWPRNLPRTGVTCFFRASFQITTTAKPLSNHRARDLVATCSIRTGLESAPASRSEGPSLIG